MSVNRPSNSEIWQSRGHQPRLLVRDLGLLVVLFVVGWAGAVSSTALSWPAANVVGSAAPVYSFEHSSLATITPTVTLTPTATVPPPIEEPTVYLPLIQKQIFIPGSLSLEEVYTANYDGGRQTTFRPCQALMLWIRMRNDADIPQAATLFWRTQGPEGRIHANLGARRQVNIPPGESTWRFFGAPDLDVPAGEYRFGVWFTSGTDRQELAGAFTVAGQPVPIHYLEGFTAKIDPRNYEMVLSRTVVPLRVYATHPVRVADVFTGEDEYVVQSTLWEGVRPESTILTRRYRPDGRPWGTANYGFRYYEIHPRCLRRHTLWWEVDEWMLETPGQWRLQFSTDGGQTWQGQLYFTLMD